MKYLFVTLDGGGNLQPQLALAHRMRARGHDVRFLASTSQRATIQDAGFRFAGYEVAPDLDLTNREWSPVRDWDDEPQAAFNALCEHVWFGPALGFAKDVLCRIDDEPVDALAVDYFLPGALVGAERAGVPTVALWHTTFGEWAVWNQGLPALNQARTECGLEEIGDVYEQYRRVERVLVLTSKKFDFAIESQPLPSNVRHVGPQFPDVAAIDRGKRSPSREPLILVSLSTTYQGQEDVLRRIVDALGNLPVRAIVTTGPAIGFDSRPPENVEVKDWVPHGDVLDDASLVITHAGLGTVMAAVAYGVPMICFPMGRDQNGNAARIEHLGLGRVLPDSAAPETITESIRSALEDTSLPARSAQMAEVIRAELRHDDGVRELEAVAAGAPARGTAARSE